MLSENSNKSPNPCIKHSFLIVLQCVAPSAPAEFLLVFKVSGGISWCIDCTDKCHASLARYIYTYRSQCVFAYMCAYVRVCAWVYLQVCTFVGTFVGVCMFVGTKMYTRIRAYQSYVSMYVLLDVISTCHLVASSIKLTAIHCCSIWAPRGLWTCVQLENSCTLRFLWPWYVVDAWN